MSYTPESDLVWACVSHYLQEGNVCPCACTCVRRRAWAREREFWGSGSRGQPIDSFQWRIVNTHKFKANGQKMINNLAVY